MYKNKCKFFTFSKGKKKIVKKKCESIVKKLKKTTVLWKIIQQFIVKNTLFAIKEYLEKNIYPEEITSLDCQKTKKNRKGVLEKLWEKTKGLD